MQRVILVVSPDADFLLQIRSHLEEGGRFQVTCASTAHEALNYANNNFYEVAILDGELDDIPLVAFSRDLEALQSELKILVFPPDNNPRHPLLEGLVVNGFLSKPFSGPEIGKALSNLFSSEPTGVDVHVRQVDELMKDWLQDPKTGREKADHFLKTTTAEAVLISIKGQITASAGSMNDILASNVTGFLSRYWKEDENNELARFLRMDGDSTEKFLYATKLVSNVVLVFIYPYTTTIQQIRRELNQVKDDFQKNYPTTGELRQEIADRALAEIKERNKKLEALQTHTIAISQDELDILKQLESNPKKPDSSPAISEEELADLNKMIVESTKPELSKEEMEMRRVLQDQQNLSAEPAALVSEEELTNLNKLITQLPEPDLNPAISEEELTDLNKTIIESMKPELSKEEMEMRRVLQDQQNLSAEPAALVSEEELANLNNLIAQMPEPDPSPADGKSIPSQNETVENEHPEWVNELEYRQETPNTTAPSIGTDQPSEVVANDLTASTISSQEATKEPLPEIDFKLPWEMEEPDQGSIPEAGFPQAIAADGVVQGISSTGMPAAIDGLSTFADKIKDETSEPDISLNHAIDSNEKDALETTTEPQPVDSQGAVNSFEETLATALEEQTDKAAEIPAIQSNETKQVLENDQPPQLKDFCFIYHCVLIPENREQFLARDLSERLSVILPQLHLAQGWQLSSITIRPQYMQWSVSVPLGICPQQIIHVIRGLTSAHLFANFPEIARKKTSDDFWSSRYLAVSGSEPPPVSLITDFVAQVWKKQETNTP